MPFEDSQVIICTACGHRMAASKDPKFCPECGKPIEAGEGPAASKDGEPKSTDDVLRSVDAFLKGIPEDGETAPADGAAPPPPSYDAPGSSAVDSPQLTLPGRGPLAGRRGSKKEKGGETKRLESKIRELEEKEKIHKVKRITVVERKVRRKDTRRSAEQVICQNCRQVYNTIHIQKCMTCGSSYLRRITAEIPRTETEEAQEPDAGAPLEGPPAEAPGDEPMVADPPPPPGGTRKTAIRYYDQARSEPLTGPPSAAPRARPEEPPADDPRESSDVGQDLEDILEDRIFPEDENGEPLVSRGWEAALKESDPVHKKREMSTFSHEYFLNKQIGGYVVKDVLGRGGMGTVFRAVRLKDEMTSALKILPPIFSSDEGKVERFTKEARSAMKLDHANIVRCYDVGVEGDINFIAMEYIEGKSVGDLIKEKRALKIEQSLRIIKEAAIGLGAAHERGIIHRDIKPDNILITNDNRIMVADFGLARDTEASSSLSGSGEIVGTPYYISPEQIDCLEVDSRADIYSLGATIYHLITGKHPFQGVTPMEVLLKHVNEKLIPPVDRNPLIPNSVSRLIEKMMEKNRDFRYPAVAQLIRDIGTIESGGIPTITLEREQEEKPKKKKKKPVVIRPRSQLLVGTVLAGLIVVAAFGIRTWALPEADLSPLVQPDKPFDPEVAVFAEIQALFEKSPLPFEEIARKADAFLETFPKSSRGDDVKELKARTLGDRRLKARKWMESALARAENLRSKGMRLAAWRALDGPPADVAADPEMTTALSKAREELSAELSRRAGMAFVPPGTAALWTAAGQKRRVDVPAFFIDFTEVSNADYRKYIEAAGARSPWSDGFPEDRAAFPVTDVSFEEASAFAAWAGKRLPREEEWIRAAAGDENRAFPWGDRFGAGKCNTRGAGIADIVEVDAYPESLSPFGCHNMAGNAAEWSQSLFHTKGSRRLVLGGSFLSPPAAVRTGVRLGAPPDYRHPSLGFRCVKDCKDE
jgi:serine/threonine protein kinase